MSTLKSNVYFKIAVILVIIALLMIPTAMIHSLINEREARQHEAINEVSSKWAGEQIISGPILMIPFTRTIKDEKTDKLVDFVNFAYVLPYRLNIDGKILPEQRNRGIYEIVVYNSNTKVNGEFDLTELKNLDIPLEKFQFENAKFIVGLSDLRGVEKQVDLKWNNSIISFNPGVPNGDIVSEGINANLVLASNLDSKFTFDFELALKGSQRMYFTPVGKETSVSMESPWTNPSFEGSFLPDDRNLSENGFTAKWNVLHINRNFPQAWIGEESLWESTFGIDLLLPVDNYQKTYRSITYALLFIAFTFLTFFFIEIMNKIFIHPIQYLLVGVALVIFYTLLLSISEYISFNKSFLIATLATILLIAAYTKSILKSNRLTVLLVGILSILYIFNFVIIQMQDYSLLIGSIGIFLILAIVMYTSRKIDWYNLNAERKQ